MGFSIQEIIAAFESDKRDGTKNALNALRAQVGSSGGGEAPDHAPLSGGVDPGFGLNVPNAGVVDPGFAVAAPNAAAVDPGFVDHAAMGHVMGGGPVQAPGPGGLAGARQQLEAPGVFDNLTARQTPPNPGTNLRLGQLEQTRQRGLDTALEEQAQQFEPGLIDQIAKYGGLAALVAGTLGLGNRRTERRLKQLGGLGLGFARGRQQGFRADQDRDFKNETAQRNAEFGAESAPLLTMQRQMMAENKATGANQDIAGDNLGQLLDIRKFGLAEDKFGLAQQTQDFREGPGGGGGGDPLNPGEFAVQYLQQRLASGDITPEQMQNVMTQYLLKTAGGVPLGLGSQFGGPGGMPDPIPTQGDINKAQKELDALINEQKDVIGQGIRGVDTDLPGEIFKTDPTTGNFVVPTDSSFLGGLRERATTGDLRSPIEGSGYLPYDIGGVGQDFGPNTGIQSGIDSLQALSGQDVLSNIVRQNLAPRQQFRREAFGGQQVSPQVQALQDSFNRGEIDKARFNEWLQYYQGGGQ